MIMNTAKTKCTLVTGKPLYDMIDEPSLNLTVVNIEIEQVGNQKVFGITLDKTSCWDEHAEELCKKSYPKENRSSKKSSTILTC